MTSHTRYDVCVVGGGPGGCAAAKRCAELGLSTVVLEKHALPRNKVCTGMIMGEVAQTLLEQHFGKPPAGALTTPSQVKGLRLRAPGAKMLTVERRMPFAWRRDFDFWLVGKAKSAGAEVLEGSQVVRVETGEGGYAVRLDGKSITARYVIGADGTLSIVRKSLFPGAPMAQQLNVRRCYEGNLDLEPEYVHYFFLADGSGFDVNRKGEVFLLEVCPRPGQGDGGEIARRAEDWLAREFGFAAGSKPLWRDGCYEPAMNRPPFREPYPVGLGDALLVGNAAGLNVPMTGEGIGTALQSGLLAAEAVAKALRQGGAAADYYTSPVQEMLSRLRVLYPAPGVLRDATAQGMDGFLEVIGRIYSDSLKVR